MTCTSNVFGKWGSGPAVRVSVVAGTERSGAPQGGGACKTTSEVARHGGRWWRLRQELQKHRSSRRGSPSERTRGNLEARRFFPFRGIEILQQTGRASLGHGRRQYLKTLRVRCILTNFSLDRMLFHVWEVVQSTKSRRM